MCVQPAPRVFLAEDSLLICMDLENILIEIGCEVVATCAAVHQGLEVIAANEIDAAILDYSLEDGTSEPLIEALKKKGTPFALCTAWNADIAKCHPTVPVLGKPYSVESIKDIIQVLVGCRTALQA
jgi:CheY-like chemotaxis protein